MIGYFFNPALPTFYAFITLANALGALYALYWNIRASGFPPLSSIRRLISLFAAVHFVWLTILLVTPIGVTLWLNIYLVLNLLSWNYVWAKQARRHNVTVEEVTTEFGREFENEVLSMVLDPEKEK